MKAMKAFIKPLEAPQGTMKIYVNFFSSSGIGTGSVNILTLVPFKGFKQILNALRPFVLKKTKC